MDIIKMILIILLAYLLKYGIIAVTSIILASLVVFIFGAYISIGLFTLAGYLFIISIVAEIIKNIFKD